MKRVFNKTLVSFMVIFLSFTSVGMSVYANETINDESTNLIETKNSSELDEGNDLEVEKFYLSSEGGKQTFLSAEAVVFNFGIQTRQESAVIDYATLDITIPKQYVDKQSIKASETQIKATSEILDSGDNYVVRYTIQSIVAGTKATVPVIFKTFNDIVPHGYQLALNATLTYGKQVVEAEPLYLTINNGELEATTHVSEMMTSGYESLDDREISAGFEDPYQKGFFSTNLDELDFVYTSYTIENLQADFGHRNVKEVKVEEVIPEGAVFDQSANKGWVYNTDTHTASYTIKLLEGMQNTKDLYLIPYTALALKYPGAKDGQIIKSTARFTVIVENKAPYEKEIILEDSITYVLKAKEVEETPLTELFVLKNATDDNFIDHQSVREQEIVWRVNLTNYEQDKFLENTKIIDHDLDSNLKYTGISYDGEGSRKDTFSVDIVFKDDSTKNVGRHLKMSQKHNINLEQYDDIDKVIISSSARFKAFEGIDVFIHTKLKDPNITLVGEQDSYKKLTNSATFEANYEGEPKQVVPLGYQPMVTFLKHSNNVYLERTNSDENYLLNEIVDMKLSVFGKNIVENYDTIEVRDLVEILPDGILYEEGSSLLTVGDKIQSTLTTQAFEPEVIYDYKQTGKTALVWKLDDVTLNGKGRIVNNPKLYSVTYKAKVTEFAKRGQNEFNAYLVVENGHAFPASNGVEDTLKISDFIDKIEHNKGTLTFVPTKEFFIKKEVKGNLDKNYRLSPNVGHVELGGDISYKITLMNNREDAVESLYILDVFPHVGDFEINEGINRQERGSTLALNLKEAVTVPEDFDVFYTTEQPTKNSREYYRGDHWVQSVSDYSTVKAIKLELKDNAVLEPEYEDSFEVHFTMPEDLNMNQRHVAVNTIASAPSASLDFVESNKATAELSQFLIEGVLFEDIVKDGQYDALKDKALKGVSVQLFDEFDKPVLDENGNESTSTTDKNGYYALGINESGKYKIKVIGLNNYSVTDFQDTELGSHLNPDRFSKWVTLNADNKIEVINGGLYKETVSYTMNKVWIKGPAQHPNIEIQLNQNGQPYGDVISLENGVTEYTWDALDKLDQRGEEFIYTVDEVTVPENYTKTVVGNTITNTYVSPKTEYTVFKVWVDGPHVHPSIEVQLFRDGVAFEKAVTLENGVTEYTWDELDLTDENGIEYVYTVDEVTVPENYTKTVVGNTITNTYVSPKTEYTVFKVWVDGPHVHPTIEVQLFRDGVAFEKAVTLENGVTEYTWDELDLTDENGIEYVYTVDEVTVPENYTKTVVANTITNTYQNKEDTIIPADPDTPDEAPDKTPDEKVEVEQPTPSTPKKDDMTPSTGISNNIILYGNIMLLCTITIIMLNNKKNKQKR